MNLWKRNISLTLLIFNVFTYILYIVVLADARDLPFPNESFDCVFDKGLLDAVLSGDYSAQNSKKVINHIYRALKKDTGVYIIVSHGFPE